MYPHRPYLYTFFLYIQLVIQINAQTDHEHFTDSLMIESNVQEDVKPAEVNPESKEGVNENEMVKLINPTTASASASASSSTILRDDETTAATPSNENENDHGKPTMTVTAIQLGTSRYFHPATFDQVKDEHPHSVIFPVITAVTSAQNNPGPGETAGSGFNLASVHLPSTLPSFDYEHEFPSVSSFEDYPENNSPTVFASSIMFPFNGKTQESPTTQNFSEESKELSSTESDEFNPTAPAPEELVSEFESRQPSKSTIQLDSWPADSINKTKIPEAENPIEISTHRTEIPTNVNVHVVEKIPVTEDDLRLDPDEYQPIETIEELSNDFIEGGNEIPEALPNPFALVGSTDSKKDMELQNEFGEALRKVEPRRRQRRPGPGTKRKVRMRVRKVNNAESNSSEATGDFRNARTPSDSFGAVSEAYSSPTTESNTNPPNRRYRSTTTPIPDPSPPTVPSTKFELSTTNSLNEEQQKTSSVVKSGQELILLRNGILARNVLQQVDKITQDPSPQIEKPNKLGFTEKISTYHYPEPVIRNQNGKEEIGDEVVKSTNYSSPEWLQSANSKHQDVHHHEVDHNYFQGRDNWEKNYMNLQQNSFYGAMPENLEHQYGGETLVELNRDRNSENPINILNRDEGRGVESHLIKEHRELPSNDPTHLNVHSINIPKNHQGASLTFNAPKIVFVEPQSVKEYNTEKPEIPILQRPPESQYVQNEEPNYTHSEFVIHPGVEHNSQEDYTPLNHPDLAAPTTISSDQSEFQTESRESHFDRTKFDFIEPTEEFVSTEIETSTSPPLTVIMAQNPAPQVVYTGFQITDNPNQSIQSREPEYPSGFPSQKKSEPFSSHEFFGFGNEKHLMPDHISSPIRFNKSPNYDKYSGSLRKLPDSVLQKQPSSSFNSIRAFKNNEALLNPEQYEDYSTGRSGNSGQPYIPFPREQGGSGAPSSRPGNTIGQRSLPAYYEEESYVSNGNGPSPNSAQFPPAYKSKGRTPKQDLYKSPDFSSSYPSGAYNSKRLNGVSPSISLPMPGLVNIPTPPPDGDGMHEVTPNRHFPPHTHSMASRPDYEPANPPLPNAHPLQHHFDPFLQNTGDFHDEEAKREQHKSNPSSNFKIFNEVSQGSSAGLSVPYYTSPQSQPPSIRPGASYDNQYFPAKPPTTQPQLSFTQVPFLTEIDHPAEHYKYSGRPPQTSYSINQHHNHDEENSSNEYKSNIGSKTPTKVISYNYLENEGESQEGVKEVIEEKKPEEKPSPYSEVPYVLMFSNTVPQQTGSGVAAIPLRHKIKPDDITGVDTSALGSELKNSMGLGPGYHSVPMHPRDQMLQVLANTHYENMMEEYMEKKKKPPSSIYTPYGVLVPMGPTAAASTISTHDYHPNTPNYGSHGGKSHALDISIKTPILTAHKHLEHDHGRIIGNVELKATVEPALELLAEKVAFKLSALEYILKNRPKHLSFHLTGDPRSYSQHSTGNEGSYSEQKPVKASPPNDVNNMSKSVNEFPPPSPSPPPLPKPSKSTKNNKVIADKESSKHFKLYIKGLLKERLFEMLNEMEESGAEPQKSASTPFLERQEPSNSKPWASRAVTLSDKEKEQPKFQSSSIPKSMSMFTNLSRKPPEPRGILQSIKRFFSFGSKSTQQASQESNMHLHFPNFNLSRNHQTPVFPNELELGDKFSTRFKKRKLPLLKPSNEKTSDKLNAKDVEKILSILLKSDVTTTEYISSQEAEKAQRKLANSEALSEWTPQLTSELSKTFSQRQGSFDLDRISTSSSNNQPFRSGIRMVAPPRHNVINTSEKNRRHFINSKIDKGHWRIPRSFTAPSRRSIPKFKKLP